MIDLILKLIADITIHFIALFLVLILATPIILVTSIFGKESYIENIKKAYKIIWHKWKRWFGTGKILSK